MKLERITLENFRQYYGRQRITFSKDPQQNVTVIHGVNGAGKTSLFLAINWCLYGEGTSNVGELTSKEAVSRAQEGETVRMSVELTFSHNGERYLASRRLEGIKQAQGSISVSDTDGFTMMRIRWDGQAERVHNPIGTMNAILPSNVRTYFLFDGEKIDNFAKPEAGDEVRYAIYNVLKLEVLTRGRRHLEDVAAEYRRELKSVSSGELRDLIEREENAREERKKEAVRRQELEREIESAQGRIEDIDQRLLEIQSARGLQQQRDRLERDIEQRQAEMSRVVNIIRDLATRGFLIVGQQPVRRALAILDEKRARGEIPSNIRQQFVQDLIDRMECICGRPFELDSPEHQRLLALMNSSLPGSLEDDVLDTSAALRSFTEQAQALEGNLDSAMHQRAGLLDVIRALKEELDDVSRQLKGSPQEEISQLEKQRQDYRADIESYRLEQGTLDTRMEAFAKEIAQLQKQIEKARKDESKQHLLTRKANLAQRASDAIDEMYQVFADDMRKRIEAKTKEIFKLLVWKDSHFQDIRLGSDYRLEVIDRYDLPARPELSAGERQVLSLSFITAMSRISEEEAPLVMDTPFGRLSSYHRTRITEHLPELADQLVLFVTDEELRDQARRNLESRIGAEYRLEFDRDTSCTEIVEVMR
jgi:DNA sulfur modification protein DndD